MSDEAVRIKYPSEEYKDALWARIEKARAAGELSVSLLDLPSLPSLPAFEDLPQVLQNMLIATTSAATTPALQELHMRHRLLCELVLEVAMTHTDACACKICRTVEWWMNGRNDSGMLKEVLEGP